MEVHAPERFSDLPPDVVNLVLRDLCPRCLCTMGRAHPNFARATAGDPALWLGCWRRLGARHLIGFPLQVCSPMPQCKLTIPLHDWRLCFRLPGGTSPEEQLRRAAALWATHPQTCGIDPRRHTLLIQRRILRNLRALRHELVGDGYWVLHFAAELELDHVDIRLLSRVVKRRFWTLCGAVTRPYHELDLRGMEVARTVVCAAPILIHQLTAARTSGAIHRVAGRWGHRCGCTTSDARVEALRVTRRLRFVYENLRRGLEFLRPEGAGGRGWTI